MRTPTLLSSALALAGVGLLSVAPQASADVSQSLAQCSSWSITNNVFTCVSGATNPPPSGAPAGCNIAPSTTSLPSNGGQISLNASCSSVAATSWSWTGGFMQGATAASGSGTIFNTTTFTATPSNASGNGTPVSVTVTVASTNTGGGVTPGGVAPCTGFNGTRVIPFSWSAVAAGGNQDTTTGRYGNFGANDAIVIQFTTGASSAANIFGYVSGSESGGGAVMRTAVLSTQACDFSGGLAMVQATSPTINFSVGGNFVGFPALQPNTTYYVNIKNAVDGVPTCPGGVCDMNISLKKPRGL